MGRTQSRPKSKSSSKSKASAISKPAHRKVHKPAVHKPSISAHHWLLSDNQAKALVIRGIGVAEALDLCRIFKCTVEQLILWYKVNKHKRYNVLVQARDYVAKHGLPTFPAGGAWTPVKKKVKVRMPPPAPRKKTSSSKKPPRKSSVPKEEVEWWIGGLCEVHDPGVDSLDDGQTVVVQRKGHLARGPRHRKCRAQDAVLARSVLW